MPSIETQIDAAVVLMLARAAEEGETFCGGYPWTTDTEDTLRRIALTAVTALALKNREAVIDTMNLCALALSLLPKEGE